MSKLYSFQSSSTGLSIFIPRIRDSVIDDTMQQKSPFSRDRNEDDITEKKRVLDDEYLNEGWINRAGCVLKWPAFSQRMKDQTLKDMKNLMQWLATVTYGDLPDNIKFAEIDPNTKKGKKEKIPTIGETDGSIGNGTGNGTENGGGNGTQGIATPSPSYERWQNHAKHMCRMARMLSQRSDDPTRRVGCVLMVHNEVIALGWNGFPAKALYGEFPRASSTGQVMENKENYVIHAEQNALLTRNKRNLKNNTSILFISKIPAPECIPMLMAAGIRHIVVPKEPSFDDHENTPFFKALESNTDGNSFWPIGYWPAE